MIDVQALQKRAYVNKVKKGFNVTDVNQELNHLHTELSELFQAHIKKLPTVGEELADVAIYVLGLAEILKVDLEKEILKKMEKNEHRIYQKNKKGVLKRVKEG
jgi:NTP pyrophosphatase (non-canonical NTP hydrolase)